MKPIGKLDQNDAYVARHREQHLAEAFRLLFFVGIEAQAIEFRHAVDEFRDGWPESGSPVPAWRPGVFDYVVQ